MKVGMVKKVINDLVIQFKKMTDTHGDKIVFDSYKMRKGLYIKLKPDGGMETLLIDRNYYKNNEEIKDELYLWFKERDYYSNIIDTNKSIDPNEMKIHSNNYLTCFLKRQNLPDMITISKAMKKVKPFLEKDKRKVFNEVIEQHFYKISNPREYGKGSPETKELFDQLSKELPIDKMYEKPVTQVKDLIIEKIDDITNVANEFKIKKDEYIKIFVDLGMPIEEYKEAFEMYCRPRIFNDNYYSVLYNDEIWGLSNFNMGMNSKKPYLSLKTTKFQVPFRLDTQSALISKKFYNWLSSQDKNDILMDSDTDLETDFIKTIDKSSARNRQCFNICTDIVNKKFTIIDYDYIPSYNDDIKFTLFNYLCLEKGDKENKYVADDRIINKLYVLEKEVDFYFFNERLIKFYYKEPRVIHNEFSKGLLDLLIISRKAFHDFFKKGVDKDLKALIDRVSIEIVKEQIKMAEGLKFTKASKALNLRLSLLKYFKLRGGNMGDKIKTMIESMKKKLESEELVYCENDDEFFFLSGQLAYYLLFQSEADKKTHGLVEPFLRSKTAQNLKKQLAFVYDSYKHAILFENKKFNNAMSAVQGYSTENDFRSNQDMFLAGFMTKNIFYIKKEQGGR